MPGRDRRTLQYAVAASILLHALLFASFPHLRDALRRGVSQPAALIARLIEAPPAVKPAPPEPEKPRPRPAKPAPAVKPAPLAKPQSQASVEVPPAPIPAPAPAPEASGAPAASSAPAPRAGADATDADVLAGFRRVVIDEAERIKRYPPIARENNWTGRVVLGITVRANGAVSYRLTATSGYDILDQQALETLREAMQRVDVPAPLRGREFAFQVPFDFGLIEAR